MDIGIVSVRYAKALLRFAAANGEEESVYKEMCLLADTFVSLPQLHAAMLNPVLTAAQKAALLSEACTPGGRTTASTARFINLVTDKKRAGIMMFIANSYAGLYRKDKHIVRGRLVVPAEVSDNISRKLRSIVENRTDSHVDFEVAVDSSIGGGFILEYDNYRLDASLKTQLEQVRRELKN